MNILINCLSSVSGGAVAYLRNAMPLLFKEIQQSGGRHELRLLAHESQKLLFPSIPQYASLFLNGKRPAGVERLIWERQNIQRYVKSTAADVLFVPYQVAGNVDGLRQVLMLRNMEPFHYHKYHYDLKGRLRNAALKSFTCRSLRRADRVIAVSMYAESHLTQVLGVQQSQVHRIYHGRNPLFAKESENHQDLKVIRELGLREGGFILTCGSLLPYRRCEDVIAGFSTWSKDQHQDLQLVVAGSGNDRGYANLVSASISRSGCAERIRLLGHVDQQTMAALYRCCRLCIIASEVEACPNIAIEAMTSGAVIVASDSPPLPEMFAGAALHYPSRDVAALASAIQRCMVDEKLRMALSARAVERALDFSWERCAQETFAALTQWQ